MDSALSIAKHFEGLRLKPYVCPAGFWTIGYGHLCEAGAKPLASAEEAERLLLSDLAVSRRQALTLCPGVSGNHLEVLTDFVFNLGSGRLKVSTLRKCVNARQFERVPAELRKWVWGGGRKLPGLILRREADVNLWRA